MRILGNALIGRRIRAAACILSFILLATPTFAAESGVTTMLDACIKAFETKDLNAFDGLIPAKPPKLYGGVRHYHFVDFRHEENGYAMTVSGASQGGMSSLSCELKHLDTPLLSAELPAIKEWLLQEAERTGLRQEKRKPNSFVLCDGERALYKVFFLARKAFGGDRVYFNFQANPNLVFC